MDSEKAKSILYAWLGITLFQLVTTIIVGLMVMFWKNNFTLFTFCVMILFLVIDFIAVSLMLKQYKESIESEDAQ